MLVDTHAHLDFVEDVEGSLDRAKEAGIEKIITIGTSVEASKKCVEIAEKYSSPGLEIFATCGVHPEDGVGDSKKFKDPIAKLKAIAKSSKKVVAIGECGLDYHLETSDKRQVTSNKNKEFQRKLFVDQIELAKELELPLVVHCRNGWGEIFELLSTVNRKQKTNLKGVFHSWTGDWKAAQKAINLEFYISFSGIVTFKNAQDIQEVAKKIDLGKFVLETDSPFLTPEPLRSHYYKLAKSNPTSPRFRGAHKRNEPKNVKIIAEFLKNLRNDSMQDIASATTKSASLLFGI